MLRALRLALLLALAVVCTATARAELPAEAQALWPGLVLGARSADLDAGQAARVQALSGRAFKASTVSYFEGPQGQVLVLASVIGKHLPIDVALAVDARGRIHGLQVLKYREVYGGQVKEARWRQGFQGRELSPELALGKGIDAIGGATLSARHVTEEVRVWLAILKVLREAKP